MCIESEEKSVRIQFDVPENMMKRAMPYIKDLKHRHVFGFVAFEEWIKRKEGYDKRMQQKEYDDMADYIREIVREELNNEKA